MTSLERDGDVFVLDLGEKYWTNGPDLDRMGADPERAGPLLAGVHALFARVLVMPLPTVAAITGHCTTSRV